MDSSFRMTVRLASETDQEIRRIMESSCSGIGEKDGVLYIRVGDRVYSCEDTPEGRKLLEILSDPGTKKTEPDTEEHAWKEFLYGQKNPALLRKYGIQEKIPRCVVLFRPLQESGLRLQREMFPIEETDRLIETDSSETALILDMHRRSREEAFEYAAAAAETMESEAGITCVAGIGRTAATVSDIPQSCREARAAIETGIRHRLTGRVFQWDRLMLERLEDLIPAKEAESFRKELIPPQAEKVLNGETMETIRTFFLNDLNLSTTARQLFIHRNTLLYRMEKVRKATGLDLRKFEDAVVFRMMMNSDRDSD